jgi:hypothetical protein
MGEVDVLESPLSGWQSGRERVLGGGKMRPQSSEKCNVVFALFGIRGMFPINLWFY